MHLKIIYEDSNLIVIDKPPGIIVFSEKKTNPPVSAMPKALRAGPPASAMPRALRAGEKTVIDLVLKKYPCLKNNMDKVSRYGLVHRLDKDTSGILLIAKNSKTLKFLQNQFQEKKVEKKYIALVIGKLKKNKGKIETIIERSPKNRKKQKVYLLREPLPKKENSRKAVTEYRVLKRFTLLNNFTSGKVAAKQHLTKVKDYTLVEVSPKTGRKHQIRCHFAYLSHPLAADKLYGFKNQPCPQHLKRQFLHASYLKIKLPNGKTKVFKSSLPNDLKKVLLELNSKHQTSNYENFQITSTK